MNIITATKAARSFSQLLDTVERQESFTIMRGGKAVAEVRPVRPVRPYTLASAADALDGLPRDAAWADEVERTRYAVS
ncbi:MAG: hypothetical protein LBL55_03455 [Propionibacteriaceae bacterium]|jgi:antitoxin (DNA-binding transcriptional repressor) of toxin-antitoxin stability system|nr:hypothetical protein [Propionibacteriaceae bacterium]